MITYYEELGVAPYATKEQIERAYRWLVQKFHPDRNADFKEEAKSQFVRVQQAFDTLSDPVKRVQYDQELRRARQRNPNAAAAETHGAEPPIKKSEKRSFVLSPIWLTMIICFGVLAVAIFVLHNQSDVNASSDSHSARSLNDQRVSAVPKDLDKIVKAAQELSDDSTAIETTLNRYDRFEFTDQPLGEVVKLLQNNYPLQIFFDTATLKEAGIDPATAPITCHLKHARIKTFLNLILGQYKLGYHLRDGILNVTTIDKLSATWETRVYDCRDILSAGNDWLRKANNEDSKQVSNSDPPRTPFDYLSKIIVTSIDSGSWQVRGGCGSICEYDGFLVVGQIPQRQLDVADLLEKLSAKLPKSLR